MIFAESYFSRSGLLIANKGEVVSNETLKALYRCVESNQIPQNGLTKTILPRLNLTGRRAMEHLVIQKANSMLWLTIF